MLADDTIAAISSATGPAARMILRISGPQTFPIAAGLGIAPSGGGSAGRTELRFGDISCPAWVYQFRSPRSYTGEDLVELHVPGNPLLARMLLGWLMRHGARQAEPGEFTARAYFNGKLDLSQAEGVAATISAQNQQHLAAARRLMAGELARRLRPAMDSLAESLALVEAGIDFSEEGIEVLTARDAAARIDAVVAQLKTIVAESVRFEKLTHEPTIVLAGRPNAGKSTLTNALAGKHRSTVSPQPGTTRDALSVEIVLARGVARLIDVAGIEEPGQSPQSPSLRDVHEQMGVAAHRAMERADVLVLVRDATDDRAEAPLPRPPDLRVASKCDLPEKRPISDESLPVSAITGDGLEALRQSLDRVAFGADSAGASLALGGRHLQALDDAISALHRARNLPDSLELLAAEIRAALDVLGGILGVVSPDDILGRIFSTFCIGK
ncbi:MAG: tRNA modification GTPase [Tepidisphaeraceae bacterium]|jgi:tRNA modification GTPase